MDGPTVAVEALARKAAIVHPCFRSGSPTSESRTPRITVKDAARDAGSLEDALLEESEVDDIVGDVHAQSVNATEVFENPDPRGPCGGKTPPMPLTGASGRAFVAGGITIVQMVLPRTGETDSFMAAQLSDLLEPCGPYQSTTNTGSVQQVSKIEAVELAQVNGHASTAKIVDEGQTLFGGAAAAQSDGLVTFVFAITLERVPLPVFQSLIEAAAYRL